MRNDQKPPELKSYNEKLLDGKLKGMPPECTLDAGGKDYRP